MNLVHTVATLTLSGLTFGLCPVPAEERPLVPSITVTGSGEVSARPDTAQIQVGVVTQGEAADEALKTNNAAMSSLMKSLADNGIAEKDIQTTSFNVTPQHRQDRKDRQPPEIVGYQVTNMVQVKVSQLATFGKVLDEVVKQGANQLHGISFTVGEPTPLLDEARQKAIADARRKAELYAKATDVKLGRVLLIQEQLPTPPRTHRLEARAAATESVPIAPGEQEFRVSITVTYSIE